LAEAVCDTSPLQYLHQIRLLHLLPSLAARAIIPPAVEKELLAGKARGIDLPDLRPLDWLSVRHPAAVGCA
jgi:predicted nucleic acid-binding protein